MKAHGILALEPLGSLGPPEPWGNWMISCVILGFFLFPKSEISSNQHTRSHNQALEVPPNGPR